jgi:N-acetyl-beta-hexosaminidase
MPVSDIIPTVQAWNGQSGVFTFTSSTCLVVDSLFAESVTGIARIIQPELTSRVTLPPQIVQSPAPEPGNIFLTLTCPDTALSDQGYLIKLTPDRIVLSAKTSTGLFYAAQTFCQLLASAAEKKQLPCGVIRDEPRFLHRGIMLDVGRKYWKMETLYRIIRQMARLKLNVLHLHFTEWNAFRLESDQFPGLAKHPAYGKTEIIALQSYARRWYVTLIPEIDLPAHATVITRYEPSLAFTCQSMSKSRWLGGESGGWTIDYSNPQARQWMRNLVAEFLMLFDSPYFHIGTDEVPDGDCADQCPSLVNYAREKGYPYTGDVLVEWINDMNQLVKAHGKTTQIWSWYEHSPHSLLLDKDVIINAWVDDGVPDAFLEAGYKVISSPENTHYLTPGFALFPDVQYLYQTWTPNTHPNILGYKLCVWADRCEGESDEYFESLVKIPRAILAERIWNANIPIKPIDEFIDLSSRLDSR